MNLVWAQAALYEPPTVLGLKLRAYSPFHAMALEAVQSPFTIVAKDDFFDLVLAVHICSRGWADRYLLGGLAHKPLRRWGRRVRQDEIARGRRQFLEYLSESWQTPQFWQSASGGPMRAHWLYHLTAFAMRELNMSEQQAWDCPIARLVCYRAAVGESEGDKNLVTEEEQRGIDMLKSAEKVSKN